MSTDFAKLKFVTGYTPWQKAHDDGYTVCTLDEWPIAEYRLIELNAALDAAEVLQQRVAQAEYLRDLAGREHRHCMADRDALRERVAALEADLKRVLTEGGVAVMDMLVTERARADEAERKQAIDQRQCDEMTTLAGRLGSKVAVALAIASDRAPNTNRLAEVLAVLRPAVGDRKDGEA